jgi:hypothetical protein
MPTTVYSCDVEAEIDEKPPLGAAAGPAVAATAMAPTTMASTTTDPADLAALDPPYTAYAGVDYSPTQMPAPAVAIVDVGVGMAVADAAECASACSAEPTCNAASYYGDNPSNLWPGASSVCLIVAAHCARNDSVLSCIRICVCMKDDEPECLMCLQVVTTATSSS